MVVINKKDLVQKISMDEVTRRFPGYPVVRTSAINNQGIEQLEEIIEKILDQNLGTIAGETPVMVNLRHARIVQEACEQIGEALQAAVTQPLELATIGLREAWVKLGEITGETASDELLERVFSEFCIGK